MKKSTVILFSLFIFQVLVNRGVTNFNDNVFFTDMNGDSLGTVKAFNLNYQFSVGYVIDFNKKA